MAASAGSISNGHGRRDISPAAQQLGEMVLGLLHDNRAAHAGMAPHSAVEDIQAWNGANRHVEPLIGRHPRAGRGSARAVDSVCEKRALKFVRFTPFVDDREMNRRRGGEANFGWSEPKVLRCDAHSLGVPVATRENDAHSQSDDSKEPGIDGLHDPLLVKGGFGRRQVVEQGIRPKSQSGCTVARVGNRLDCRGKPDIVQE